MLSLRRLFLAGLSSLSLLLAPLGLAAAATTQPIFKTTGGDVFAGGWFYNGNCNTADNTTDSTKSNYQAPFYNGSSYNKPTWGGIEAWSQAGAGSSADLAAVALGDIQIDHTNAKNYGFISKLQFSNANKLSNDSSGGDFEGKSRQAHCIADYYTSFSGSAQNLGGDLTSVSSGKYSKNCGVTPCQLTPDNITNITIAAGQNTAVFVKGNVYINKNITYAGAYNATNVPKFVLVVQGNLYLAPGVSQLDGWYIAQPDRSDQTPMAHDTGDIWTCHENQAGAETANWVSANCSTHLTVNGALVAKQLNLLRTLGDVSGPTAEDVNFTPEMLVGNAFYGASAGGGGGTPVIDSLTSLPPVL